MRPIGHSESNAKLSGQPDQRTSFSIQHSRVGIYGSGDLHMLAFDAI